MCRWFDSGRSHHCLTFPMQKRILRYSLLFLAFTALGLFFSAPLYRFFTCAIPYNGEGPFSENPVAGDHLQILYILWLTAKNLFSGTLWNHYEFAATQSSYCLSFFYFPLSFFLAPIVLLWNPIVAYNFFLIASFGLTGLFTFLLVRTYTRESWGALMAALLFALCPYRLSQLFGGHINGFISFYIPLSLYAFEKGRPFLFLFSLIGLYCGDLQLLYFFLLFFSPYFLLRLATSGRSLPDLLRRTWPIGASYIVILSLFLILKENFLSNTLETGGHSWQEIISYPFTNFLKKSPRAVEGNLYLGWGPFLGIFLGMLAFLFGKKNERARRLKPITLYRTGYFLLATLFALILTLGTTLNASFPLYDWFYDWVPYFSFSRTPSRLFHFAYLMLSILAGLGFSLFIRVLRKRLHLFPWKSIVISFCRVAPLVLILLDLTFFSHIALCRLNRPPATYQLLAQSEPKGKIVLLPLFSHKDHFSSLYEYAILVSGRKTLQGYSSVPPTACRKMEEQLAPLQEGNFSAELLSFLKSEEVNYIVFHPHLYKRRKEFPDPAAVEEKLLSSPHLVLEKKDSQTTLFQLK